MATYQSKHSGAEIDAGIDAANSALPKSGGTMSGALTLHGDPSENNHAATKKYVDDLIAGIGNITLQTSDYGDTLPTDNLYTGRLFFLKKS